MPTTTMWMLLTIVITFVCGIASTKLEVYTITTNNATHITNGSFYTAGVIKAHNQLVYVSYPRVNNDTSIKLNWNGNRSCEIVLPQIAYQSTYTQSLGNGKVIVALVEDDPSNNQQISVRFYAIDYQDNCNYDQFVVNFGNEILYAYQPIRIVPYHDNFDVVAKSSLHCEPKHGICMIRYTEKGKYMGTRNFDFDTTQLNVDLESVHPLREFESSSGYVYISKHTSTLHVLDSNLKTIKTSKTPGPLNSHSILNGDIGICYNTYEANDGSVECLKVDSRMKIKTRIVLTDANYFGTRRLYNLLDGSSLLVSLSRGRLSGLVKRLGVDGKLGAVATLFQYECQSLTTEPQDYFAELKGGIYCLSFACRYGLITHCTKLSTDDKLPVYLT